MRPFGSSPLEARLVQPSTSGCRMPTARLVTCRGSTQHREARRQWVSARGWREQAARQGVVDAPLNTQASTNKVTHMPPPTPTPTNAHTPSPNIHVPQALLYWHCASPAADCQPGHRPTGAGGWRQHWPCAVSVPSTSAASPVMRQDGGSGEKDTHVHMQQQGQQGDGSSGSHTKDMRVPRKVGQPTTCPSQLSSMVVASGCGLHLTQTQPNTPATNAPVLRPS